MSRCIVWKPVSDKNMSLGTHGASSFQQTFEKIFGALPKIVTCKDIERLEVIKSLNENEPAWQNTIDLIHANGAIEIMVEW